MYRPTGCTVNSYALNLAPGNKRNQSLSSGQLLRVLHITKSYINIEQFSITRDGVAPIIT